MVVVLTVVLCRRTVASADMMGTSRVYEALSLSRRNTREGSCVDEMYGVVVHKVKKINNKSGGKFQSLAGPKQIMTQRHTTKLTNNISPRVGWGSQMSLFVVCKFQNRLRPQLDGIIPGVWYAKRGGRDGLTVFNPSGEGGLVDEWWYYWNLCVVKRLPTNRKPGDREENAEKEKTRAPKECRRINALGEWNLWTDRLCTGRDVYLYLLAEGSWVEKSNKPPSGCCVVQPSKRGDMSLVHDLELMYVL